MVSGTIHSTLLVTIQIQPSPRLDWSGRELTSYWLLVDTKPLDRFGVGSVGLGLMLSRVDSFVMYGSVFVFVSGGAI